MDRNKAPPGKRPLKGKGHLPSGEFVALGKTSGATEVRRSTSPQPIGRKIQSNERKREAPSSSLSGTSKKPKLSPQTFTPLGRSDSDKRSSPAPVVHQYEESAIDVNSGDLYNEIVEAEIDGDDERVEGLLCGAVKHLKTNRSKPDQIIYLTTMYLAKTKSALFCSEVVIDAFCSLLKRDMSINFKSKGNPLVSVFACNVLLSAFAEEENWPDNFVKVYVEDSLGERVWVDRDDCKSFVDNIQTAFGTKIPPKNLLVGSGDSKEQTSPSSPHVNLFEDEDTSKGSEGGDSIKSNMSEDTTPVFQRYPYQQEHIESYILDLIREQLNRRQPMDSTARNLIRLMSATCGYSEVRTMASQRLEMWLQNPKLARTSQDLLMSVCMNCVNHDKTDLEVIAQLIKIRLKTKPLINHYLNCMRELLSGHPENLKMILTHTIYNELSNARNPNNMALLGVIFTSSTEQASKILAEIFQDLLTNKDDYLRALRALFREIIRSLRHEFSFPAFCLSLMSERTEAKFSEIDMERYVMSITDLITLSILLGISPAIREAVSAVARGDNKDLEILQTYKNQVAVIQRDSVWWLHTVVPKLLEGKPTEYVHCLHKVLFMETPEHYYNKDNWPPEGDRSLMLRLATEVPVLEDTLMRVLVIGLSRELQFSAADAVELADQLIKRAASLYHEFGMEVLQVERLELIDALLNLCTYRYPENITLPKGYTPPNLAISALYWKGWLMLLTLAAYNPSTFGVAAWDNYSTLKLMMEMVMTNNYKFPPPTTATDEKLIDDIKARERQINQKEIQEILEFETHLAAATSKVTITEANSLLVDQLTTMDPGGVARCPPAKVLDQLQVLNMSLKIGQMLCRNRNPDFLLDVIQRQGTSQSMPWLAELVESSEGSLDVLPIQCLCEFLLHETEEEENKIDILDEDSQKADKYRKKQKKLKQKQLLGRLQALVHGKVSDSRTMFEVLDYFLQRLSSSQSSSRTQAIKGLSMVVSRSELDKDVAMETDEEETTHTWLLKHLPSVPLFQEVKGQTCLALRNACQIETSPNLISAYIIFLSLYAMDQSLQDLDNLALDTAQLIVERTSIINHILPAEGTKRTPMEEQTLTALVNLYMTYLIKATEQDKEAYNWSNTQDQIILQWESGRSATMHILAVHAMIILLTYGAPDAENNRYDEFLSMWFPEKGSLPTAFLLDTSEEALLLPDWLKLKMIRSSVDRLVMAALEELEPAQLLLFIQSFGIPVSSMGKLLHCLDRAMETDAESLQQAVVDKAYMAQLIEIQHMRGAEGGDKFYQLLTQTSPRKSAKKANDVMESEETGKPWLIKAESSSNLVYGPTELVQILLQIFSVQKSSDPQSVRLLQELIKTISSEGNKAIELIQVILKILQSAKGSEFMNQLFTLSTRSCLLFKIIISKLGKKSEALKDVLQILKDYFQGQKSPLMSVIGQYFKGERPAQDRSSTSSTNPDLYKTKRKLDTKKFISGLEKLSNSGSIKLEKLVDSCMTDTIQSSSSTSSSSSNAANMATDIILYSQQRNTISQSAASLLIDWLELLEPELIQSNPTLQQKLIFAKGVTNGKSCTRKQNHPYLLALLTHQGSWKTLNKCITQLLQSHETESSFDPTAVLDFLWACLHIPKIWQGREQSSKRTELYEDVLGLTDQQILSVVDFIIEETSHDQQSTNERIDMSKRMELLIVSLCGNDNKVKLVVSHVQKKITANSMRKREYEVLLLELYLQFPYLLNWLSDPNVLLTQIYNSEQGQSQLDGISHRMITALGRARAGKAAESRMYDANIACRKLASEHPLLILRQLPMIAALLQGRTELHFTEFRNKNYLLLFSHVLGILDILQPQIFTCQQSGLAEIYDAYFSLIERHGRDNRQLGGLIVKFVSFLQNFVSFDSQKAVKLLQKYVNILSSVSQVYPSISELKALLASLTLPPSSQTEAGPKQERTTPMVSTSHTDTLWTPAQLAPFLKKFRKGTLEEVLQVLHDLDETSKRRVEVLSHFETELQKLMYDVNDRCRNTAFTLIMRHIRQNPRRCSEFVPIFLQCIESRNPDVIQSALSNLAEFTVLAQEHAQTILQKTFLVGIRSNVETSSYISETIQLLNLETAQS
ncbi:integrator complex subunit 1 [Patella vulgata]|uniref:integrator complex subunit 1 n=1 Tax=Patella vulgata TaxID=6465 RepID=UPI0024A96B90|nr:integrator complex subunit 1 [Patella vulgata]